MFKLYSSLSKQLEAVSFAPGSSHLNVYTCGPTVYGAAQIGNLRAYISADLLWRGLFASGLSPRWVMNITDVDDKTIRGAVEQFGKDAGPAELRKYTEPFFEKFVADLEAVGVLSGPSDYHTYSPGEAFDFAKKLTFVRITDVIPEIQSFVVGLIEKGFAYSGDDGSVYFAIEKYQEHIGGYGDLMGEKFMAGKKVGARVKVDEYSKDDLSDFALWKAYDPETDGQIFWDHPTLGKGRPGWHIECSAVNSLAFGGEVTDIHTGGVDLLFPHHTNEIAQSEGLCGKGCFVRYWLHNEHLQVDGKRMGKSMGNAYRLDDLEKRVGPVAGSALRYLFLQSHYRTQQNFTEESFVAAAERVVSLSSKLSKVQAADAPSAAVLGALAQDVNAPQALAAISGLTPPEERAGLELLGVELVKVDAPVSEEVEVLAGAREAARKAKDFAKSDELRAQIEALGFEVLDSATGQQIRKRI